MSILSMLRTPPHDRALPILSFPAVQKMDATVDQLVHSAELMAQAMEIVARETGTLAAVSLMDQFSSLRAILLPFLVINLVGMIITFAVTGRVTQFFLNREKGEKK